jgi:hypothetical protein
METAFKKFGQPQATLEVSQAPFETGLRSEYYGGLFCVIKVQHGYSRRGLCAAVERKYKPYDFLKILK